MGYLVSRMQEDEIITQLAVKKQYKILEHKGGGVCQVKIQPVKLH